MEKIKIDIIQLGNSRYLHQWHFIDKLLRSKKSKLFEIISIKKCHCQILNMIGHIMILNSRI